MNQESANARLSRFHERMQQKRQDNTRPPLLITAFGDSVTEGAMQLGIFDYQSVYHARLKRMLESAYPGVTFNMINAGICAQAAGVALGRIDRDVIRFQPDLVLVAFGLNDSSNGPEGLDEFSHNLRQMVTLITQNTNAEIILVTTNHIISTPNDNVLPDYEHFVEPFIVRQKSGLIAAYAQRVRDLAREFSISIADVYERWDKLAQAGIDTTLFLSNGLNHPTPAAHIISAELIMQCIDPAFQLSPIDQLLKTLQAPEG